MSSSDVQGDPVEAGSESATRQQKIDGIVQQVSADIVLWDESDPTKLLRERLTESGISFTDDEIPPLVDRIRGSITVDRESRDK